MKEKIAPGPFAFPFFINDGSESAMCSGMDLRDYFAAKALTSITNAVIAQSKTALKNPEAAYPVAQAAYAMADAMLKARRSA